MALGQVRLKRRIRRSRRREDQLVLRAFAGLAEVPEDRDDRADDLRVASQPRGDHGAGESLRRVEVWGRSGHAQKIAHAGKASALG
jgi:hypothetical protein